MAARKRSNGSKVKEFKASKKPVGFFKPFIEKLCTDRLMLPLAWTHYKEGNLPSKGLLRDRYGNKWHMGLNKVDNKIYFFQGWTAFVKQNYMKQGEIFFFQYDGIRIFDVKIIGTNSCVKEGLGRLVYKVKEEEVETNDLRVDDDKDSDWSYANANENESNKEYKEVSSEEKVLDETYLIDSSESSKTNNGLEYVTVEEEEVEESNLHKRRRYVDPHGFKIFNSGIIPRPRNPHFITKIKKKRQDELLILTKTIKVYKLELPMQTILRDAQGRDWETCLVVWKDGRKLFQGGWRKLCKVNLVGEHDLCICEFVQCEKRGLHIQVHLVPSHSPPQA